MRCSKCHTENPHINNFCRECGTKLILVCPQCQPKILPCGYTSINERLDPEEVEVIMSRIKKEAAQTVFETENLQKLSKQQRMPCAFSAKPKGAALAPGHSWLWPKFSLKWARNRSTLIDPVWKRPALAAGCPGGFGLATGSGFGALVLG